LASSEKDVYVQKETTVIETYDRDPWDNRCGWSNSMPYYGLDVGREICKVADGR
jgi:hypothetical protein